MTVKNVYFTDGSINEVDVLAQNRDGIVTRQYGKETFYPWHRILKIGQQGDHLR